MIVTFVPPWTGPLVTLSLVTVGSFVGELVRPAGGGAGGGRAARRGDLHLDVGHPWSLLSWSADAAGRGHADGGVRARAGRHREHVAVARWNSDRRRPGEADTGDGDRGAALHRACAGADRADGRTGEGELVRPGRPGWWQMEPALAGTWTSTSATARSLVSSLAETAGVVTVMLYRSHRLPAPTWSCRRRSGRRRQWRR